MASFLAFLYDLGNFKHCLWYVALFKVPPLCKKSYFSFILQYTIWMVIDLSSMVQVQKIQLHNFVIFLFPSQPKRWPIDYHKARMSLNDVRFNSNWVFFSNNNCLQVDIQFQKFMITSKFGLAEGVIFNFENGKLSWREKW